MANLIGQGTLGWAGVAAGLGAMASTLLPGTINATAGSGFTSGMVLVGGMGLVFAGGALAATAPKG